MQIEAILDTWQNWDIPPGVRPRIIRPLGGGRSNRSFLIVSGEAHMVLRVNATDELLPGRERDTETRSWRAASAAGVAPMLLHSELDKGFLVSAYIENNLPGHPAKDMNLAHKALELLQACHRLDVDIPAIDYMAHVDAYRQIIEDRNLVTEPSLEAEHDPARLVLKELLKSEAPTTLCHHDPVQENFVGGPGKMYLIDWEYAARGLRALDYAAFAREWGLDDATIATRSGIDIQLLSMAGRFYRYQCRLWETIALSRHTGSASQPFSHPPE